MIQKSSDQTLTFTKKVALLILSSCETVKMLNLTTFSPPCRSFSSPFWLCSSSSSSSSPVTQLEKSERRRRRRRIGGWLTNFLPPFDNFFFGEKRREKTCRKYRLIPQRGTQLVLSHKSASFKTLFHSLSLSLSLFLKGKGNGFSGRLGIRSWPARKIYIVILYFTKISLKWTFTRS